MRKKKNKPLYSKKCENHGRVQDCTLHGCESVDEAYINSRRAKRGVHAFFFLIATLLFLRVVIDPDLGWHLRVGDYVWQNREVPTKDLFSFSMPDYPYVYHSWLTELFVFLVYSYAGLWGVSFFYGIVGAAGFWFMAKITQSRLKNSRYCYLILLFIPVGVWIVQLRTQVVTFLGMAILYYLFNLELERLLKRAWLIPPLFVFWVNFHGGFFLGLGWLLMLMLLKIWEVVSLPLKFKEQRKIVGRFSLIIMLSFIGSLLNPYGIRAYHLAWQIATNKYNMFYNLDWQPLFTETHPALVSQALLFGGVVYSVFLLAFASGKRSNLQEKLLVGLFFFLSLKARRYVLPLFIVALPVMVAQLEYLSEKFLFNKKIAKLPIILSLVTLTAVLIGGTLSVLSKIQLAHFSEEFYANPSEEARQESVDLLTYPYGAVVYMREYGVPERMLNLIQWGGYLIWKLPGHRFFIDGRMDTFYLEDGRPITLDYLIISNIQPGWQRLLNQYRIEAVLGPPSWPLVEVLRLHSDWEVVYEDEGSVLLRQINL